MVHACGVRHVKNEHKLTDYIHCMIDDNYNPKEQGEMVIKLIIYPITFMTFLFVSLVCWSPRCPMAEDRKVRRFETGWQTSSQSRRRHALDEAEADLRPDRDHEWPPRLRLHLQLQAQAVFHVQGAKAPRMHRCHMMIPIRNQWLEILNTVWD